MYFSFIFISWRLITLQYCSGFCHTLIWINHGFKCVPHPEPLSHLPPHPIPWGHPTALALSTLSHALNLDWQSTSHMIIYMLQCYSFRSSHPCLLPQSPKDCSMHLCLFFCLAYRVIITIFLNSICTFFNSWILSEVIWNLSKSATLFICLLHSLCLWILRQQSILG